MTQLSFPDGGTSPARIVDLYCRPRDDRDVVLWRRAVPVVPVSDFPRGGRWIQSGHYVIDYEGDAIVVYCGNCTDKRISVQFIGDPVAYPVARRTIKSMLLGKLVVTDEQRAAVFEQNKVPPTPDRLVPELPSAHASVPISETTAWKAPNLTAEKFAAAVEGLIHDARAKGLSEDTLLIEIEDIASLLREGIDDALLRRTADLIRRFQHQ